MKQTWLLSCLGSLGKRKKNLEGKLNAMFTRETQRECDGKHPHLPSVSPSRKIVKQKSGEEPEPECEEEEEEEMPEYGEEDYFGDNEDSSSEREIVEKVLEKETVLPPPIEKRRRVGKSKRRKSKKEKMKSLSRVFGRNPASNEEIFAKAKIDSKGSVSANVGRKYK